MPFTLPPELTHLIMGCLHDDSATLGACSLTCRAWVMSSQAHMFRTVSLVSGYTRGSILELLESSPHIAQYVRILQIDFTDWWRGCLHRATFLNRVMPQISQKMINVKELEVTLVTFHELDAPTRLAFVEGFPSLQRLALLSCTFERLQDFTSLILGHPYIECIESQMSIWTHPIEDADLKRPTGSLRHLHTLAWEFQHCSRLIIDWVLSTRLPTSLHTIAFRAVSWNDTSAISRLINALGPSLEHFDMDISGLGCNAVNHGDAFMALSMSNNTELRTLCIRSLTGDRPARGSPIYTRIPAILSTVRSSSLEEIALHVECCAVTLLELGRVDDILGRAHFDGLRRVVVCLRGSGDGAKARRAVRYRMKGVKKRGLLVFERRFGVDLAAA